MRLIVLTTLLCAAAATPAAAFAQAQASRSVDEYLCTFAGKCGDEAQADVTKDAPETKGFSLARPGEPRVSSTRGFSLARPATKQGATATAKPATTPAKATATASTTKRPAAKPASYASKSTPAKPKATAGARADLRLTFEMGSATLTAQAREEARVFAQSLVHPALVSKRFIIEGHTDSQGGREYNMDLSKRRAQAVADYLTSLGVAADRLTVRGYGFDRPLDGRSAASQSNRRVEAVLAS